MKSTFAIKVAVASSLSCCRHFLLPISFVSPLSLYSPLEMPSRTGSPCLRSPWRRQYPHAPTLVLGNKGYRLSAVIASTEKMPATGRQNGVMNFYTKSFHRYTGLSRLGLKFNAERAGGQLNMLNDNETRRGSSPPKAKRL